MSILTGKIQYVLISITLLFIGVFMVTNYSGFVFKTPDIRNETCQHPTENNPMANVLLSDYDQNPQRSSACYYPDVKDEVNNMLYDNLSLDNNDYNFRNNSQRQFFSTPSTTIPNDRDSFLDFISNGLRYRPMCKTDPSACTGTESGQRGGGRPAGS